MSLNVAIEDSELSLTHRITRHIWGSLPRHLIATVRYVELNPVAARLCERPQDWRWSSVHAHLHAEDDDLVSVIPMLERCPDWKEYLGGRQSAEMLQNVRKHTRTGRPLGNGQFIETLESLTGRSLKRQKPGRKPIK